MQNKRITYAPIFAVVLAAAILTSCGRNDPALKDGLGANHYYISNLPTSFKEAFADGWECKNCSYFEEVKERVDSNGHYTVEFGCRCESHDIHLETSFSPERDGMPDMVMTATALECDMKLFGDAYSAYSSIVSESSRSLSEIVDEKNSDACYGEESEAYQVWYGTFATHYARFSKFANGSCKLLANGSVKPTLLGEMMS